MIEQRGKNIYMYIYKEPEVEHLNNKLVKIGKVKFQFSSTPLRLVCECYV